MHRKVLNLAKASKQIVTGSIGVVTGVVTSLQISGFGAASSELVITIQPDGGSLATYVMESDALPQMFAAATTMLTAAYFAKGKVSLVIPQGQPTAATPKISGVLIPAKP